MHHEKKLKDKIWAIAKNTCIKRTVAQDFRPLVFSINQPHLGP